MPWFYEKLKQAADDVLRSLGMVETPSENLQNFTKMNDISFPEPPMETETSLNLDLQPGSTECVKLIKQCVKKRYLDVDVSNFIGSEDKEWLGIFDESIGIYNTVNGINQRRMYIQQMKKYGVYEDVNGRDNVTPWKQFLAGGASGVLSRSATAPVDRLKVMLQVHSGSNHSGGIFHTMQSMIREGGIRSLWRGNIVSCMKVGPESAIKFYAFEMIKQLIASKQCNKDQLQLHERLLAGSGAGIVANGIIYPMETIKTRMAVSKTGQYRDICDCIFKTVAKEGLCALYKGMLPGLIGMIPYAGVDLCLFETLKQNYIRSHGNKDVQMSIPAIMFCAFFSGTLAQSASYPFGLVRTKLQAQDADKRYIGKPFSGMYHIMQLQIRQYGYLGLYRGFLPSCMKVVPTLILQYLVYEKIRKRLGIPSTP